MKIEKLNKKQIALANDMMNTILGGKPKYGDTRLVYTGPEWGLPSSDRVTETYCDNGFGGGIWCETGRCEYEDHDQQTGSN